MMKSSNKCSGMHPVALLIVGLVLVLSSATAAVAHRVYIYAWVEGDTVYTESYFGSKRKVKGGLVEVFDPSGRKLLEGRTNDKGEFAFKAPQNTGLRIVVNASMGHRSEYVLSADELRGIEQTPKKGVQAGTKGLESGQVASVDPALLRAIVEDALDSRLKPIMRELARCREEKGPGLTEVIGGIGYIFGIAGLIMCLRSRKGN